MKRMRVVFPRAPHNVEEILDAANRRPGVAVYAFHHGTLLLTVASSVDASALERDLLAIADMRMARQADCLV